MRVRLLAGSRTEVELLVNQFLAGLDPKKVVDVKFSTSTEYGVFNVLVLFRE